MKTQVLVLGMLAGMAAAAMAQQNAPKPAKTVPWSAYNKGVRWEASLEDALKKAGETGKPVMLHQLVGDMKAEGC
jgi:ABC-type sugar transport system substrate-binding protein